MSDFSFTTLGVGDAFSALSYSSSLLLEAEGRRLLLDCPHPIRKILHEASLQTNQGLSVDTIDAIALTHLHADHCSGLEGFAYFNHYVLPEGRKTTLLAHPVVTKHLWRGCLAAGMGHIDESGSPSRAFDEFFHHIPLDYDKAISFGPFSIECFPTVHSVPTTAFRITAAGRCLGYSADTAYVPGLIAWLSEADLIIHETNTGPHTPYEALAALPAALRDRMRLIHYPDDFDKAESAIEPLEQGRRYTV